MRRRSRSLSQSSRSASVAFALAPEYYQRAWFLPLCAGLIGLTVWLGYRLRVRNLNARFSMILGERSRIARELHDTLIQGFSGVTMEMQALSARLSSPDEKGTLQEIVQDAAGGSALELEEPLILGQKILSCVHRLGENFGGDYTAQVLVGAREQRILSNAHDKLSTWGILAGEDKKSIRLWIEQLVGQGRAVLRSDVERPTLDLAGLRDRCVAGTISAENCYGALEQYGLKHGASLRGVASLHVGRDDAGQTEVLGQLELPSCVASKPISRRKGR